MMEREELRKTSMENRAKNYDKNRTSVNGYVKKKIMSSVESGKTSTVIDYEGLKRVAFGNEEIINDIINYYRGKDLTINSMVNSERKKKLIISWD